MPPKHTAAQLAGYAPAMNELAHNDIVYLAALIDGEGSIAYRTHPGRPFAYASVHVYNTHKPLMDWLKSLGGNVGQRVPRIVAVGQPIMRKVMYQWIVTRQEDVAYLLRVVGPYMKIKGEHAAEVYQSLSTERIWDTSRWSPPIWRGEASPLAKLTEAKVKEIRASKASKRSLAIEYGVDRRTITRVKDGASWAHVK